MICMTCKEQGHGARYCPSKMTDVAPSTEPSNSNWNLLDELNRKRKWEAEKKAKYPDLFGSSSSSDEDGTREISPIVKLKKSYPESQSQPAKALHQQTLSERHLDKDYNSKSSEYKANQQWARFCLWWEDLKATGVVSKRDPYFLDPEVFDNISLPST